MNRILDCDKMLVRGVNWVGDAVMTMPAIRSIRDSLPEARIALLVKPWVFDLFKHDPNIDDLISYKKQYSGFWGKLRASGDMRKYRFGCALLLQNAFDAAVIAALAGIPQRIGYSRDARRFLLTAPVDIDRDIMKLHHVRYYLTLLEKAGLASRYRLPWIYPDLGERIETRSILGGLKRPLVGLNPGAAYGSAKRWQSAKFARVAEHVIGELGGSIVLFGSEKEQPINSEIMRAIGRGFVAENTALSLAGKTTLGDLCNLIAACDLLVTNDSGPMHIAYAVGTPLIALFGSTSPELTGPLDSSFEGAEFGYRYAVLRSGVECSPCFERTCRYGHLRCMEEITAELVIGSMQGLLPSTKAVFFDRDGTLCRDTHYLNRMDDLEIHPEIKSLRTLKERGYLLIGISNQSGIARGLVDEEFVKKVNRIFVEEHGFDAFYYCPHHPDERCACRKPMNGMLLKARADFNIDLRKSFVVGDTESDMKAARLSGAEAIQITPHEAEELEHATSLIKTLPECLSVIR